MADTIPEFVVVTKPSWKSRPLATFTAMASTIEARFGPAMDRDLDSNGLGRFDALCVRFRCGLEVDLARYHCGALLRRIDPAIEPSVFELHADQPDLAHVAFHLAVPLEAMSPWTHTPPPPSNVIVMRTDDNGNEVEVTRVTSRCEAEALVREYEARAHKQTYWIA